MPAAAVCAQQVGGICCARHAGCEQVCQGVLYPTEQHVAQTGTHVQEQVVQSMPHRQTQFRGAGGALACKQCGLAWAGVGATDLVKAASIELDVVALLPCIGHMEHHHRGHLKPLDG